jgi:hypothetical protein
LSRTAFTFLCCAFLGVWLLSVGQDVLIYVLAVGEPAHHHGMFDVDEEKSFYTWMSVGALVLCSVLAFQQAGRVGRDGSRYWQWITVGGVFVYLSADEQLSLHERLGDIGARLVDAHGIFAFAWVVPAMGLVALVGVLLIGLVMSLPPLQRNLSFLSAAVFLGGAVGLEMVGGWIVDQPVFMPIAYRVEVNVEEFMEVAGVLIFMWVLVLVQRGAGTETDRARSPQQQQSPARRARFGLQQAGHQGRSTPDA